MSWGLADAIKAQENAVRALVAVQGDLMVAEADESLAQVKKATREGMAALTLLRELNEGNGNGAAPKRARRPVPAEATNPGAF